MEKTINCYSRPAVWLKYISYAVLILGCIAYIATFYISCLTLDTSYLSKGIVFEFSFSALFTSLPVLIGSAFCFGVGLCISAMTINSEQKSAYLSNKAKEEGIEFDFYE